MMLLRLILKNILARKSSLVIVLFIAGAISLFVVTNSIFDRTEHGIEEVFEDSFTGDFVVRPKTNSLLSLFGDETPVTGSLTEIEPLFFYSEICDFLDSLDSVESYYPQVTGSAVIDTIIKRHPFYLFGVDALKYKESMPSFKIIAGEPYKSNEKGVMVFKSTAEDLNLEVGSTIQFLVAYGSHFRIRSAPVTAIYDYEVFNSVFEQYVLIDPNTLRSLINMSDIFENVEIDESKTSMLDEDLDMDDLFSSVEDTSAIFEEDFSGSDTTVVSIDVSGTTNSGIINDVSNANSGDSAEISLPATSTDNNIFSEAEAETSSWNFIVCNFKKGTKENVELKKINQFFNKNDYPVEAISWRNAVGRNAMYLYWMRIIFNVGILVVLAAGFIIVNNTLVISVLDRIREIGTMRSIGASQVYISFQFFAETFLIAITSGVLGCILGIFLSKLVNIANVTFTNSFLIQLFGGEKLITKVTFHNLRNSFVLSLFLGFIGWIYPVKTALSVTPVKAMQGAK